MPNLDLDAIEARVARVVARNEMVSLDLADIVDKTPALIARIRELEARAAAPSTLWADEYVHEYGAAGLVGCGKATGGGISRMAGYTGLPRRTTTSIARVTCPDCLRYASEMDF